jgi:hypothetical protein
VRSHHGRPATTAQPGNGCIRTLTAPPVAGEYSRHVGKRHQYYEASYLRVERNDVGHIESGPGETCDKAGSQGEAHGLELDFLVHFIEAFQVSLVCQDHADPDKSPGPGRLGNHPLGQQVPVS